MRFVVVISAVALGHIAAAVASTQADRWPADLWERLGRELLCLPVPIDAQYVCIVLLPSAQKWELPLTPLATDRLRRGARATAWCISVRRHPMRRNASLLTPNPRNHSKRGPQRNVCVICP